MDVTKLYDNMNLYGLLTSVAPNPLISQDSDGRLFRTHWKCWLAIWSPSQARLEEQAEAPKHDWYLASKGCQGRLHVRFPSAHHEGSRRSGGTM